ncbi:putative POM121-like protein 1 [Plecturocebus cupreus]
MRCPATGDTARLVFSRVGSQKRTLRAQLSRVEASESSPLLPEGATWTLCAPDPCPSPSAEDLPVGLSCLELALRIPQFTFLVKSPRRWAIARSSYKYSDTWNQHCVQTTPRRFSSDPASAFNLDAQVPHSTQKLSVGPRSRESPLWDPQHPAVAQTPVQRRSCRGPKGRARQRCLSRTRTPESKTILMVKKGAPRAPGSHHLHLGPYGTMETPLPLVPRPEPPQRDLHAQRSQPCRMSPCRKRNAISSSYSSTGSFPGLKRRRGPDSSHCHVTLMSEDNSQAVSQAVIHTQGEKAADATPGEKPAPRNGSPTSQASRPRRRKFPLLPRRREEPLMLPPPLKLGFRVTAEDLDLEKEVALRSIDSALRGDAKAIWECRASWPSQALSLPATGTSPPAVPKAPIMDAQQETHKSQDSLGRMSLLASAAGAPSPPAVSGRKCRSAEPLLSSDPLPATSSHSQDTAQVTLLIPAPFPAPSVDRSLRSPRPGASAASATTGAFTPATRNPMSGSPPNGGQRGPSHP